MCNFDGNVVVLNHDGTCLQGHHCRVGGPVMPAQIPTRENYYVKAVGGRHLRLTFAQTPVRANELMSQDIERLDLFQKMSVSPSEVVAALDALDE